MIIQPNTDMTGTGSDWVGIVKLTVRFVATKPAKQRVVHITTTSNIMQSQNTVYTVSLKKAWGRTLQFLYQFLMTQLCRTFMMTL